MNVLLRFSICVGTCASAFATLQEIDVNWRKNLVPSLRDLPSCCSRIGSYQLASTNMDAQLATLTHRIRQKRFVAREVISRRTTLVDAAREFARLDLDQADGYWVMFRDHYRGDTDLERHCQEVISFTYYEFQHDDPAGDVIRCELEHELELRIAAGEFNRADAV